VDLPKRVLSASSRNDSPRSVRSCRIRIANRGSTRVLRLNGIPRSGAHSSTASRRRGTWRIRAGRRRRGRRGGRRGRA
jgi:hypothetical protein